MDELAVFILFVISIVFWVVVLALGIFLNYIFAKKFELSATLKGYGKDAKVFPMCFWLGLFGFGWIGYLFAISLPNLKDVRVLKAIDEKLANLSENKE